MWWMAALAYAQGSGVVFEGLTARWEVSDADPASVVFEVEATTTGWVLVGANDEDAIVGADLAFVRVLHGEGELVRHKVHGPGDHRPDPDAPATRLLNVRQENGRTWVRVAVPRTMVEDRWLVLAWSVSPDLDHHSRVRRHVRLEGLSAKK